jgi:hypothetical protein
MVNPQHTGVDGKRGTQKLKKLESIGRDVTVKQNIQNSTVVSRKRGSRSSKNIILGVPSFLRGVKPKREVDVTTSGHYRTFPKAPIPRFFPKMNCPICTGACSMVVERISYSKYQNDTITWSDHKTPQCVSPLGQRQTTVIPCARDGMTPASLLSVDRSTRNISMFACEMICRYEIMTQSIVQAVSDLSVNASSCRRVMSREHGAGLILFGL